MPETNEQRRYKKQIAFLYDQVQVLRMEYKMTTSAIFYDVLAYGKIIESSQKTVQTNIEKWCNVPRLMAMDK